jgi:hypothetical protein
MPTNGRKWKWKVDAPGRKIQSELHRGRQFGVPFERKHGLGGTLVYNSWKKMMQRCYDSANPDFKNYGGRGISVCEQWHNPTGFVADMGTRGPGLSLERLNVNGHYEPGNCGWIPHGQQSKNRTEWQHTLEGKGRIAEALRNQPKRARETYLRKDHPDRLIDTY